MDAILKNDTAASHALDLAFRSGMSRSVDLHGAIEAGVPAGVVAGELLLLQKTITIPRYLSNGGAVFIDSGAFSELKTQLEPNFRDVLATYKQIAERTRAHGVTPASLYVVAPDKVGDQWASIERLCRYEKEVRELIEMGVKVIIPIQVGPLAASELVETIRVILESDDFVVGIPSNAAAMSIDECATLKHHSFHILGRVQKDPDQIARILALRAQQPDAQITADANWLRSRLAVVTQRCAELRENGTGRHPLIRTRTIAIAQAIQEDATWAAA
jgi:hypothetical protein